MPQPAFSVRPASCTLPRMSSIESRMVPDTVQLMVEVAGLCSCAPAFEVTRPAGIAPRRNAHRNCSFQVSRTSGASTSARARATRLYVSSIERSIGVPSLADRRYFLSQMSSDASWNGMLRASEECNFTAVLIAATRLPAHGGCRKNGNTSPFRVAAAAVHDENSKNPTGPGVRSARSAREPPGMTLVPDTTSRVRGARLCTVRTPVNC
jgi:hypothetical protein